MPMRIGIILYPLVPLVLMGAQRGPVSKFYRAGAISPDTARRPASINAAGDLEGALRKGLLVGLGDGRYYVDMLAYRRWKRQWTIIVSIVSLVLLMTLLVIWPPSTWLS